MAWTEITRPQYRRDGLRVAAVDDGRAVRHPIGTT
jgi:hypothetical protein